MSTYNLCKTRQPQNKNKLHIHIKCDEIYLFSGESQNFVASKMQNTNKAQYAANGRRGHMCSAGVLGVSQTLPSPSV